MSREQRVRQVKMYKQKIAGILLLAVCVVIAIAATHAQVKGDLDGTPILLLAPLGIYLVFTKELWI